MALRCGDIRRGVNIASEIDNKQLKRDCAEILDAKKVLLIRSYLEITHREPSLYNSNTWKLLPCTKAEVSMKKLLDST